MDECSYLFTEIVSERDAESRFHMAGDASKSSEMSTYVNVYRATGLPD